MSDYRYHIGNHFSACRHVANARDPHRGRDVKLYHIPGNFEVVGIFDGTDAFISPINIDPLSAGIQRIYEDIRAGKSIEVKTIKPRVRVEAQMELPLYPKPRVRVAVLLEPQQPEPVTKERVRV